MRGGRGVYGKSGIDSAAMCEQSVAAGARKDDCLVLVEVQAGKTSDILGPVHSNTLLLEPGLQLCLQDVSRTQGWVESRRQSRPEIGVARAGRSRVEQYPISLAL